MSLAVFVFFFALYLITSSPLIYSGDSGGLTTAAFSLGPAHPPGYMLYSQLGKAFSFLPIGNIAHRMSMLSGLYASLSALLVYKAARKITDGTAAFFAVGVSFLSALLWSQSVMPEVYTLNLLICSAVFYLCVQAALEPEKTFRNTVSGFFLTGLGTANHHTVILMAGAIGYVALINLRHIRDRLRILGLSFIFFLSGFMCNLGLILRGQKEILYNHSPAADVALFFSVFLRARYGSATLSAVKAAENPGGWFHGAWNSLSFVFSDTWYFIPLLAMGVFYMRKNLRLLGLTVLMLVIWAGFMGSIAVAGKDINPDQKLVAEVYFLPLYLPLSLLWACGFYAAVKKLRALVPRAWNSAGRLLPACLAVLPLAVMLPANYPRANLSGNYFAYEYAKDAMSILPQRSILVAGGDDPAFATSYLKAVERRREDVPLVGSVERGRWFFLPTDRGKNNNPTTGWFISAADIGHTLSMGFKVFFTHEYTVAPISRDFALLLYGPLFMLVPNRELPVAAPALEGKLAGIMEMVNIERLLEIPDDSKDYFSWIYSYRYSKMLIRYARVVEKTDREKAYYYYDAAFRLTPFSEEAKTAYEDFLKRR